MNELKNKDKRENSKWTVFINSLILENTNAPNNIVHAQFQRHRGQLMGFSMWKRRRHDLTEITWTLERKKTQQQQQKNKKKNKKKRGVTTERPSTDTQGAL